MMVPTTTNTFPVSYNVHGAGGVTPDQRARVITHLAKIKPAWVVVMNDKSLGLEIRRESGANIIFRQQPFNNVPDEKVWEKISPQEWVKIVKATSDPAFWNYTNNESGDDPKIIEWICSVIDESRADQIPLVVGNFNTGQPDEGDYIHLLPLLRLIAAEPHRLRLGLHEYGGGVLTSGLVGGAPDDPRHVNYLDPDNWPRTTEFLTAFHLGRFKTFIYKLCDEYGIKYPPIVITEGGMDYTSDINYWLDGLPKTPPYTGINHWRSLQVFWSQIFSKQKWSHERAYFEQIRWAIYAIYLYTTAETYCLFSWGNSGGWEGYNLANAGEFQAFIEGWAEVWYMMQQPDPTPPDEPDPEPEPETPPPDEPDPTPDPEPEPTHGVRIVRIRWDNGAAEYEHSIAALLDSGYEFAPGMTGTYYNDNGAISWVIMVKRPQNPV